ncbi:phage tail tape measure C-terminal domain-containing protein [Pseudomonas savastanoi pv. phaseolicola]|uniref:Bacteriophage tail tape measure C-terminal domain-containing protein n=4 Tax=Pseudomonas savastanoi TaxID=29438 RepID=A0A3M6EMK5_PSESG|nr:MULTISPECIES: phage tail tape measure C-terminal domain-containing protein [Pseudomonas]AAZ36300.1 tail tape meausure protein, truncated [Pseudomonas savastanoi pv. phaseolicola 1448A]KPB37274.1 Uncharacterized protein AC514_1127 [Pseudomonas savastanoi pv. phaseolicola]KPB38867.1 Uncharacterized protein AC513_3327 [Pseudomonas savastanoi pv. phaseolicola]KPB57636.1 Uncharacterized protein AC508_4044 [Pseudomonas amygdali pv. mellea]KPB67050.1 Uncharacterized protein AC512_1020 [Pseudomonas
MNDALEKAQVRITAARAGGHKITAEEEEATYKSIRDNSAYKEADPKPYREDAGTKMLDQARQQYAVLQEQSKLIGAQVGEQQKLGAASQDLIQWEQQLADIKGKKTLTADQQSLLAVADQITAQKKLSADLEVQNALRTKRLEQEQKLAAFAMSVSDSLAQNQQRLSNDVAGIGMGDKQADRLQEDLRIRQDYAKQIEKLRRDQQNNGTSKQLLDDETGLLQKALETRLQQQADYYAKVDEAQQNWNLGASAALQNYVNDAQNYSAQAADFVSGSLNDATNGLGGALPAGVNAVVGSVLADGYKAVGSGLTGITTRWYKEPAAYGEAQCIELRGSMAAAGGYIYMQPTANVVQTNLAAGDVIEMLSAVEIMGSSRGILAWEAELTITKTVNGTSSTFYYRSMDKYQEPFTMPASFSGELETQRGTIDLTETVITSRMGLYLAAGVPQESTVKAAQFGIRKV